MGRLRRIDTADVKAQWTRLKLEGTLPPGPHETVIRALAREFFGKKFKLAVSDVLYSGGGSLRRMMSTVVVNEGFEHFFDHIGATTSSDAWGRRLFTGQSLHWRQK